MTQYVSQAEFARQLDCAKSYVTKLKLEGRLVMSPDGKQVDAAASLVRIAETDGQKRPDVAQRHAQTRNEPANEESDDDNAYVGDGIPSKAQSSAKKEHFLAAQAELDYQIRRGEFIPKADMVAAVADVSTTFRQSLENFPHRVAAELYGKDMDAIRATLKAEIIGVLHEMDRNFAAQLAEIGKTDELAA